MFHSQDNLYSMSSSHNRQPSRMSKRIILTVVLFHHLSIYDCLETCMYPVTNSSEVFGNAHLTTPILTKLIAVDVDSCQEICCKEDDCNVVAYNQTARQNHTNCFTYACDPLSTCSFVDAYDLLLFVDRSMLIQTTPTFVNITGQIISPLTNLSSNSAASIPNLSSALNSANTHPGGSVGTAFAEKETLYQEQHFTRSFTKYEPSDNQSSLSFIEVVETPTIVQSGTNSIFGLASGYGTSENIPNQNDLNGSNSLSNDNTSIQTVTASFTNSIGEYILKPMLSSSEVSPPLTLSEVSHTTHSTHNFLSHTFTAVEQSHSIPHFASNIALQSESGIIFYPREMNLSISSFHNTKTYQTTDVPLEPTSVSWYSSDSSEVEHATAAVHTSFTSSASVLFTLNSKLEPSPTISSYEQNTLPISNTNILLQSPMVKDNVFTNNLSSRLADGITTRVIETNTPILTSGFMVVASTVGNKSFPLRPDGGLATSYRGGLPTYMVAILISALALGCMSVVIVLTFLGKRVYDSYQKRHYHRLDYLINGMYN